MTRMIRITGAAAILLGGLIAGKALSPAEIGVTISDSEAATLHGGACLGSKSTTCPAGACASKTVFVFGELKEATPIGDAWCGGSSGYCGLYYSGQRACTGG